ncbi:MAG: diguanylate cyclase [Rhodospirillaceae bacterium]|nr:diguanylate cyclase [Rhodospirillaceae bacterium]
MPAATTAATARNGPTPADRADGARADALSAGAAEAPAIDGGLAVSAAALTRYEEAVYSITAKGVVTPVNPAAVSLHDRLGIAGRDRLVAFAHKCIALDRAHVDMVDIGAGETAINLQVTFVPLADGTRALCFVRDLTLDYSLRRALVDSRRRYRDFVEICADFTWEVGPDRKFVFVAPRGGHGYSAEDLTKLDPAELLNEPTAPDQVPFFATRRIEAQEFWLKRRDGKPACVHISALPLIAPDGTWHGARGTCRDVTDTRDREATLARVHNREKVLTRIVRAFRDEVNPEAMLAVAAEALAKGLGAEHSHVFRTVEPAAGQGAPSAAKPRYELAAKYGAMDLGQASAVLSALSDGAGAAEILLGEWQVLAAPARFRNLSNGAAVLWRKVDRGPWSDDDRLLLADIANQIGVTIEQLIHHEHILRISRTDALTGLLNRGAFMDTIERHLKRLRRDTGPSVLMYVDLDNFKAVNDFRGHAAGDEALFQVREILLQSTRPTDVVARLGGDEFAVWLVGADQSAGESRARQILERSKALASYSGSPEKPLGMSIGIAPWSATDGETVDQLIARADAAMYGAKKSGKGRYVVTRFGDEIPGGAP